jgi:fucose 4-O-acetylase-like acetyltransferase
MIKSMLKPTQSAQKAKVRDPYLDIMKGLAILLVVVGHAIQSLPNYQDGLVFRTIYSFHIPLFMFLSGAVASYSSAPMDKKFIWKKFLLLVVPFVAWAVVSSIVDSLPGLHPHVFFENLSRIAVYPDWGLWFLWVLFLNFCCLTASRKLFPKTGYMGYVLVWLVTMLIPTNKYGIGLVKWHFPFFAIGYLIFKNREKLAFLKMPTFFASLVSFPILIASWHWLYLPNFLTTLPPHLASHHLDAIEVGDLATIHIYRIITLGYSYIVAFAGIGLACLLLPKLKSIRLNSFLNFLGLYTMEIYVLFWYFLDLGFGPYWLNIAMRTAVSISLALFVAALVLYRSKWLSFIFLGGRSGRPIGERTYQKIRHRLMPGLY